MNTKNNDYLHNNVIIENLFIINDTNIDTENAKHYYIKEEINYLNAIVNRFNSLPHNISNSKMFIDSCIPCLLNIKNKLSDTDLTYLQISTAIAAKTQEIVVSTINTAIKKRNHYVEYLNWKNNPYQNMEYAMKYLKYSSNHDNLNSNYKTGVNKINQDLSKITSPPKITEDDIKLLLKDAWSVVQKIGELQMDSTQKKNFDDNKKVFKTLYKQFDKSIFFIEDIVIKRWIAILSISIILDIVLSIIANEFLGISIIVIITFLLGILVSLASNRKFVKEFF